jgi:hypothetical protein
MKNLWLWFLKKIRMNLIRILSPQQNPTPSLVQSSSWKRKFRCWFQFRFYKSDPVMVLGNFGLKPMVNCQLTLVVDHFFPKRNNPQKIVNLVLELGLVSNSKPSISSRTRSGFYFFFPELGPVLNLGLGLGSSSKNQELVLIWFCVIGTKPTVI